MNFRMRLRDPKRDEEAVANPWIASGKDSDARAWARAQMDAWGWLDGVVLECAGEYVAPKIVEKKPDEPKLDERGYPILEMETLERFMEATKNAQKVPDVYVPEDDNL